MAILYCSKLSQAVFLRLASTSLGKVLEIQVLWPISRSVKVQNGGGWEKIESAIFVKSQIGDAHT